jgi:hypothetical protein
LNPRFTLACIFSMFLVLSTSITFRFQPTLAYHSPRPISAINSSTTQDGTAVTNGGTVSVLAGQRTVAITFRVAGADESDANTHFECRLSGGSLPATSTFQSPCGTGILQYGRQTLDGTTYAGVLTGNVAYDLGPSSTPYRFEVKVVNDGQSSTSTTTSSQVSAWTFTVRETPAGMPQEICGDRIDNNGNGRVDEDPCPTVRIIKAKDGFHSILSSTIPTTSPSYAILGEARGQMLNRLCTAVATGGIFP